MSPLGVSTILVTIIEYRNSRVYKAIGDLVFPKASAGKDDNEHVPRGKAGTRWRGALFVGRRSGSGAAVPAVSSARGARTAGPLPAGITSGEAEHVSGK